MADLDDFFKKKDKKKKGDRKTFAKANTDVLAKNLEQMAVKEEQKEKKEITEMANDSPGTVLNQQDDDEWDDYRENKKDYSGLKIETLKVEEEKPEPEEEETEVNEDGEVVAKSKDRESGPWNKLGGSQEGREDEDIVVAPRQEQERESVALLASAGVQGSSYVPPHMRGGAGAAAATTAQARTAPRGRVMKAPDISSEVYFPSLGDTMGDVQPKGAWGKKLVKDEGAFEEVKGHQQQNSHRASEGPKLTLGNKFDVLGAE